jgi:hypothetical protein
MEVNEMPFFVSQDEVAIPRIVARHIPIAFCFEQGANLGDVFMFERYIQI